MSKLSQGHPGLAIHAMRLCMGVFVIMAVLAAFMDFYPSDENASFNFPRAQATAAALNSGVDGKKLFTQLQKRYMQKALIARADNLVKMHGATVMAALGEASLVRADLPTVIWQYRSESCVLDIYFKADDADVVLAPVIHYEMRSRLETGADAHNINDEKRCIRSLVPANGMARFLNVNTFYKSRQ